ncbi:MAG TPA: hypothetical protein VFO16_09605 [Pseudonocardiaceae bacterium]|nr:hypothetical protein [Pseudonocardiaceae bacterium]
MTTVQMIERPASWLGRSAARESESGMRGQCRGGASRPGNQPELADGIGTLLHFTNPPKEKG